MKNKLIVLSGFILGLSPVVALAQGVGANAKVCADIGASGTQTFVTIICRINQILGTVVPVLIALGVVYFIWGVVSFVIASDEEAKTAGRDKIIYGLIGLAVIVAVWALVGVLTRTFGVDSTPTIINPPVVPGYNP